MIPQCNPRAAYLARRAEIDAAIARVLERGSYILGPEVVAFEEEFAHACGAAWSVGVANGTDAIEIALRACGVVAGDRVATVSHTAVATVAAIARIGAIPLFVDVEPQRYTMCPRSLESVLAHPGSGTCKAVIVVHLYGQPADLPAIQAVAQSRGLALIEDCAQAHGAALDGRRVGTSGEVGCFSFYPTKNLGALGDGGAVIGNGTELRDRMRLLREYGWRERYVSQSFGLNSRLDELQAAVLRVKLLRLHEDNRRRAEIAAIYDDLLGDTDLTLPTRVAGAAHVFHQYVLRAPQREQLRARLHERGIGTLVHYPSAVHQQPAYAYPAFAPLPLPNTEALTPQILSLPMFPELSNEQVRAICDAIKASIG